MDKTALRKEILTKRRSLESAYITSASRTITKKVTALKEYRGSSAVLLYADFNNEVKTGELFEISRALGKTIYYPRVIKDSEEPLMEFFRVDSPYELEKGAFGILEPVPDEAKRFVYDRYEHSKIFMAVPGVAFAGLNRLGYGRGFYDRYLSDKPGIFKCGICFEIQKISEFETDRFDIPMDIVLSE